MKLDLTNICSEIADWIKLAHNKVEYSSEHVNELSFSIKEGKFSTS
jgi:hypothetical protein